MNKPTLTINGKKIEMLEPKARFWRQGIKLSEQRKDLPAIDYVDAHCEFIAQVFGVSVDEVLDNVEVIDVMPLFYDILAYIMGRLWLKLADKKNAEVTDAEKA